MIRYKILETGAFLADGGAMFGPVPKRAWSRRYPSDDRNCCRLAMNCLLVWNENRIVLLDTGVGTKALGKLSYYGFRDQKDLRALIHDAGFEPGQITDVVLSHLHFDHCGGCSSRDTSGNLQVTFPNATHWVGKKQWESYLKPNVLEKDAYRPEDMSPVFDASLIRWVEADFELFEGFRIKLYDGHTKSQLVSFIEITDNECLLFPSDVIPTKAHLSDEWISAYDIEPLQSLEAKIKLKKEIKKDIKGRDVKTIFYHDSYHLLS